MDNSERRAVHEMLTKAFYWWSRYYRKNSDLYVVDYFDVCDETKMEISTERLWELEDLANEIARSLDKISFEEISRLINLVADIEQ